MELEAKINNIIAHEIEANEIRVASESNEARASMKRTVTRKRHFDQVDDEASETSKWRSATVTCDYTKVQYSNRAADHSHLSDNNTSNISSLGLP